jgi:hypothetical protein
VATVQLQHQQLMAKDWKDAFLSSGFPLEFDTSNVLLQCGFHVDGEQPFTRRSEIKVEDHSIDLSAHRYIPKLGGADGDYSAQLIILCECKYRRAGKTWVFMPDLNDPDFSPAMPTAVRCFHSLTSHTFDEGAIRQYCSTFESSLKAIEIHNHSGDVFDAEIRHALNQLRYAIPDSLVRNFGATLFGHPDDAKPIFLVPLLLTNAPLRMLKQDVSPERVLSAGSLDELSDSIDVVDLYSPYAEDFRRHCHHVFGELTVRHSRMESWMAIKRIEQYYKEHDQFTSPMVDLRMLEAGHGNNPGCFSQFLVVTRSALPTLLTELLKIIDTALKDSKQIVEAEAAPTKTR